MSFFSVRSGEDNAQRASRRSNVARLVIGVLSIGVMALASSSLHQPASAQTKTVDSLTIALPGYENNLTPFTVSFLALPNTHDLLTLVYDTLFWSQNDKSPEPWLAESAVPSADRKEWTVKLRPGMKWHDGKPLTAEDIKFSFDYYKQFPGASGRYAHHAADTPPFDKAEVLDPLTVRLSFKEPAPTFPSLPGGDLPMIPKHIWEKVTEPAKYTALPVGSGPYKMVEAITDQGYKLEANADYFKGKVLVKKLNLVVVREYSVAFSALRTGDVDHVARNVPAELVETIANSKGLKTTKGTRNESVQLLFNARKPPFDDARVRKAISMAINNKLIVDNVLLGRGRPGNDNFLHPDSPWTLPNQTHEYDLNKSRKLLDDAGFELRGDGRSNAKGLKADFDLLVSSFEPQQQRAAQLISSQLKAVGIKVNVEPIDPATLRQKRAVVPGKIPDYDAYMSILESHAHVDPDGLYYFFHSPGTRGFGAGVTGYSNPKFDAISEKAVAEVDPVKREQQLFDLQRILISEMPLIALYYPEGLYAVSGAYDGWYSDPGHGIFTKRSFVEGENKAPAPTASVTASTQPTTTVAPATTAAPTSTKAPVSKPGARPKTIARKLKPAKAKTK